MVTCLSVSNCFLILCYLFSTLSYFFYFLLISVVTMPIASKQQTYFRLSLLSLPLFFETRAEKCVCSLQATLSTSTIVDKSLGIHSRLWGVSHRSNPSLNPQTMLDACIENFFRVSTLYKVGGGRTARKFGMYCFKREPRNDRKIWILQYCPKDFCPVL